MLLKKEIVKKLAKKYNLDTRVVRLIVDYPIKFARERISDDEDNRPIRIRYFAAFVPKKMGNIFYKTKEE